MGTCLETLMAKSSVFQLLWRWLWLILHLETDWKNLTWITKLLDHIPIDHTINNLINSFRIFDFWLAIFLRIIFWVMFHFWSSFMKLKIPYGVLSKLLWSSKCIKFLWVVAIFFIFYVGSLITFLKTWHCFSL